MDSILIYQAANDLVQNTGTRNIKRIARSCSLDILETPRFKDVLGFLSLHFDAPHRIFQMHYKVLRKRKSLPLQVPLMSR